MINTRILSTLRRAKTWSRAAIGLPSQKPRFLSGYLRWLVVLISMLVLPRLAVAVLFYSTSNPAHNTTAPTGLLTNSGWQYQGTWGSFLGTPVAPKYFLTASHVGGAVGDRFQFRGLDYTTTALFDNPESDLRLWRICGSFPSYATVYSKSNEVHKTAVVFGRGTQRGAEVVIPSDLSTILKGWLWGTADGVQRWGTNVVTAIVNEDAFLTTPAGDLLKCNFDAGGGGDEADLSVGDSGGGVFIKDGSIWKLAGINYAVDGPYNTSTNGDEFMAAIFDEGGLYKPGANGWTLTPDSAVDIPGGFYTSRVAAHVAWINGVLQSAVPADPPPILRSAEIVTGPYSDTPGAVIDPEAKTVTVAAPASTRFYLLDACSSLRITSIAIDGTMLVMMYE